MLRLVLLAIITLSICAAATLCAVFSYNGNSVDTVYATTCANPIGEIWVSSAKKFDQKNMKKLYSALGGSSITTLNDLKTWVNGGAKTSADIRNNNSGSNVILTFGDKNWAATYLTEVNGDIVLTLILEDKAVNSSNFNSWGNENVGTYPSDSYGSSQVRASLISGNALLLNSADGTSPVASYATSITALTAMTATTPLGAEFAKFVNTVANGGVSDYILTPAEAKYQEFESAYNIIGAPYYPVDTSNDAFGSVGNDHFSGGNSVYNYYTNTAVDTTTYVRWKDDKIWIPSAAELGCADSANGIWKTNTDLRQISSAYMLRSNGYSSYTGYYIMNASGASHTVTGYWIDVRTAYSIRPALHLNLTKADADSGIAKPTAPSTTFTYNGSAHTYTPKGFDNDTMTVAGNVQTNVKLKDGTTTYEADPDGHIVKVTPKTGYRWHDGTTNPVELNFVINKATPSIAPTYTANTYVSEGLPTLSYTTTVSGLTGTISWDSATPAVGTHDYGWTFVPDDAYKGNYNNATGKETLTYQTATISGISVSPKAGNAGKIYDIFTQDDVKNSLDVKINYTDGKSTTVIPSQFTIVSGYSDIATSAGGTATLMIQEDVSGDSNFTNITVTVNRAVLNNLIATYAAPTPNLTYPTKVSDVMNNLTVRGSWDCYSTLHVINKSDVTLDKTDSDLVAGANTITVSYGGKTATFTVNIDKGTYNMTGIALNGDTVTYDGSAKSLAITGNLPAGVTVAYSYVKDGAPVASGDVKDAGTYTVTATFTGDTANYNTIPDMTATLTIDKADYDMSGVTFTNKQVTYDGTAKSHSITGTLPAGVTVTYEYKDSGGNAIAEADVKAVGTYTVIAHFTHTNANYNAIPDKTATLEIMNKKLYDTSGATIDVTGAEEGSDGEYTTTYEPGGKVTFAPGGEIKDADGNVVSGITRTIRYEKKDGNGNWIAVTADDLTDAGEYRITVEYTGEDAEYAEISDEVIELTIDRAEINESDVRFTDGSGEGDGLNFDIDVGEEVPEIHIDAGSLPSGVILTEDTVSYEKKNENGNWEPVTGTPIDVGEYRVKITISHTNDNYKQLPPVYATLNINRIAYPLTGVDFFDVTEDYDGTAKNITVSGTIPDGVTVTYVYEKADGTVIAAGDVIEIGVYKVTAKFSHNDPNYGAIEDMTATLRIGKRTVLIPTYNGTLKYTGEEILPSGSDFDKYDERYMSIVEAKSEKGTDAGTYYIVFVLTDTVHYEWENVAITPQAVSYAYVLNEEVTLDYGEARAPWSIGKAIITATSVSGGLPVLSSDSYKGSFDGIVEYKYYTDEGCSEEISPDRLEKGKTYYVKGSIASGNFEFDARAAELFNGAIEYDYVGEPTFWDNVIAFFAANWIWFAIGFGMLLLLLLIILLAVRHKKKAAKRAKEEAEAEERRRKEELEERRRAEEREERRRKEEAEERRQEREMRMMMQQPVQMPVMPQTVQHVAADGDAMARMEAKFEQMLNEQRMATARAEAKAEARAEATQQTLAMKIDAMERSLAEVKADASERTKAELMQQLNAARLENEFMRYGGMGMHAMPQGALGAEALGGMLMAALQKYNETQMMPRSEDKLALPESNIVNGVVPGAITTTTTTTTVDATGSKAEEKPAAVSGTVENMPNAEGLFNRRGRNKTDGYDPDNFYNFFDEQEKKE